MKLCKDCKYYRPEILERIVTLGFLDGSEHAKCARPTDDNFVSGGASKKYCSVERKDYHSVDACGTKGKYWEER
jgi:hypothetical protein